MKQPGNSRENQLPVGRNEDVRYEQRLADADDIEAQKRADAADRRQELRP